MNQLFAAFPRDQILVVRSEDMFSEPKLTLETILSFLGLSYTYCGEGAVHNEGKYDLSTIPGREILADFVAPYNERLYRLIGKDCEWR